MDFNYWLEKTFADMSWSEAIASLIVCIMAVLALEKFHWLPTLMAMNTEPTQDQRYGNVYENLILDYSDQRVMWTPDSPYGAPEPIKIAWISDSSGILRSNSRLFDDSKSFTIPLLLSQNISSVDGRVVKLYDYTVSGGLASSNLTRAAHAVDELKADLIILAINPFWILQERRLISGSFYSKGLLINEINSDPTTWTLVSFLSPINIFTALIQPRVTSFELRHLGRKWMETQLNRVALNFPKSKKTKKPNLNVFKDWIRVHSTKNRTGIDAGVRQYQIDSLMLDSPKGLGMAGLLLRLTIERLGSSGVPTLVYIAPTNPDLWGDIAAADRLNSITSIVREIVNEKSYSNVYFDSTSSIMIDSVHFRDYVHLNNEGQMLVFFKDQITKLMKVDVSTTSIEHRFKHVQQ